MDYTLIVNEFIKYCKLNELTLKSQIFEELKKYYKKLKFGDGFVLAKGDIPIMLVAHLDTVHRTQCDENSIFVNLTQNIVTSTNGIGGDDRCGVFMIMDILKHTKHRPYILFTEDEECGGIGAKKFITRYNKSNTNINFIIELDRANSNDSVYYDLDNKDFEEYINKYGFKTSFGTYTDICELCPAFDCAGVNLSCGYYKAHTTSEYVNINEMLTTTYKVVKILDNFKLEDKFKYIEKQWHYTLKQHNLYNYYDGLTYDECYNEPYIYEVCDYCGCNVALKDCVPHEDGTTYICEDCIKKFGLKKCKDCGVAMYYGTDGDLCRDCQNYRNDLFNQERLDI